jgi:hypothetical protein
MSNPKKKDETKMINPIQKKSNKQKITKNNKNHDNNCSGCIIYAGSMLVLSAVLPAAILPSASAFGQGSGGSDGYDGSGSGIGIGTYGGVSC